MPRIYVLSGPDLGRTFDVAAGATFGRTAECAVPLRDASVSRTHARLEQGERGWRVVDTGSRNGLFAGTERVAAKDLEDGDEFRLGEVLLRFRADAAPAARAPTAPTPPAPAPEPSTEIAAPEIRFHARGASRAEPLADAPEEIELEGDWTAPAAAKSPPRALEPLGTARAPEAPRASAPAPIAATRSIANDERARKLAAAGLGSTARAGTADARGVLQFHKVAQADGVMRQELGQQPLWLRALVIALVIAGTLGLGWLAYQAATAAKVRLAPAETVDDEAR